MTTNNVPHKTPGGRSRRKKAVKSTTNDAADGGKENHHQELPSSSKTFGGSSSSSSRSLAEEFYDDGNITSLQVSEVTKPSSNKETDSAIRKEACRGFRQSLQQVSVQSSTLWEDPKNQLVESVMESSLTKRGDKGAFLLLDEHVSALLSYGRKLIREVADTKASTTAAAFDNLLVAVHILRAVAFVLADSISTEKQESLMKLLYHLITTAAEYSLTEDANKALEGLRIRLSLISMSGYEGLGYALSKYATKSNDQKYTVTFRMVFDTKTDSRRQLFAVPRTSSNQSKSSVDPGSMSVRQLCTIAMKTTAAVTKAVCNMHGILDRDCSYVRNASMYCSLGKDLEDGVSNVQEIAIKIFTVVQQPWLDLLARTSCTENDTAKELLSYAKGAHRVLWDAASNLKTDNPDHSTSSINTEVTCLELRKHAILFLLPKTSVPKINKLLHNSYFESACTYAWKAAAVFHQKSKAASTNSELLGFYKDVEAKLQSFLQVEAVLPMEYVEYFAYKALHTERGSNAPPLLELEDDETVSSGVRILINTIQMGAWCKATIEINKNGRATRNQRDDDNDCDFDVISPLISLPIAFRKQFLDAAFSEETLRRIFKIFGILSIQKSLFGALQGEPAAFLSISTALHAGALFLECMGLVGMALLKTSPTEASQLLDMVCECHIRPISVYEKLSIAFESNGNCESSSIYISLSDEMCVGYHDTVLMLSAMIPEFPPVFLEKAAKMLAITSRHRGERSMHEAAILPLLYSVKLYMYLDQELRTYLDSQLSQRLLMLSHAFDNVGKHDASFFFLCLALRHEASQEDDLHSINETDMLAFLANKSDGVFPPSRDAPVLPQKSLSICRRLASYLFEHPTLLSPSRGPSSISGSALAPIFECFLKKFEKGADSSLNPLEVIETVFGCEAQLGSEEIAPLFLTLAEVLSHLGSLIHHAKSEYDTISCENEKGVLNYMAFSDILRYLAKSRCFESGNTMLGVLEVVLFVSREPTGRQRWMLNRTSSVKATYPTAKKEHNCLHAQSLDSNGSSNKLQHSLNLINLSLLLAMGSKNLEDAFPVLVAGAKLIADSNQESRDDFDALGKQWAVWALSNAMGLYERTGLKENATALSLWLIALTENDYHFRIWYTSTLLSTCSDETNLARFTGVYNEQAASSETSADLSKPTQWMLEVELDLCRLHLETLNSGAGTSTSYGHQAAYLEDLYQQLNECDVSDSEQLLQLWVTSTLCLVHSDLSATFGYFPAALNWTQQCVRFCQAIMRQINFKCKQNSFLIEDVVSSSVLIRATLRYIQVLSKRPKLHYRLGDYRKADAYMRSVLEFLSIDVDRSEDHDERPSQLKQLLRTLNAAPEIRLFLEMAGWASTPDRTTEEVSIESVVKDKEDPQARSNKILVESIQNLISAGDVLYGDSVTVAFKNAFLPFYEEAIRRAAEIDSVTSLDPVSLPKQAEGCLGLALAKQVELRKARLLMESTSTLDDDARMNIRGICHDIKDSAVSCSADKAWALYYLGLFELEKARRLGTLQKIWTQDDPARDDSTCNHLRMAKSYLSQASLHTMNASDVLTRNILRSLALASGPAMEDSIGMSSGVLVLTSVGQSLRRRMTWSFSNGNDHNAENEDENRWKNIFSAFDGPSCEDGERDARIADFLKQIAILTPSGWSFVATVICPTGEILVTSLEKIASKVEFTISTRCIFASDEMTAYDCIMKPLDTILKSMQEQLHRLDPAAVAESSDKEAIKKTWWEERGRLDENLGSLLCQVEATFFSQVFDHRGAGSTIFDEDNEVPIGNLASRFDAALDGDASSWETNCLEDRLDNLKALTIAKLKEKLIMMGVDESLFKKLKKAQLIELLIEQEDTRNGQKPIAENRFDKESEVVDDCVFLILDENLHRFPFEGMPSFENRTVCRVPCLSFVLATLYELGVDEGNSPSVNPSRTTYILDPEENLMGTRSRLLPAIDSAEASGNWDWNGVVGEVPTVDVFQQGLATKDGLMLYFGHGGGQSCFSRRRIEELIDHRVQALHGLEGEGRCQASVVLMGCSSGRLVSINRKNSDSVEETPLYYEPEGIALSYLCAGAPCVIGNLWDVTDNDIDRFSIDFLDRFLGRGINLAKSISMSRCACKLRYLVGCAPVCYGIPVKPKLTKRKQCRKR